MASDQQIQSDPYLSQLNQYLYSVLPNADQGNRNAWSDQMSTMTDQFKSLFKTYVGRDATPDEINTFGSQYVKPNAAKLADPNSSNVQDPYTYLNQFVSNTFQPQARDYATQQLQQQQGQANDLASLFRKQGNEAINSTEQSLLDYQSKLFEKLRPNLLTSLNAQGLLDTGGLNSAVAGAQADMANSVQPWLAQQRLGNEQQANAISQAGAAAPYQYQQGNILNSVPYMQGAGQQAANQGYNTFLTNLNYQNQLGLQSNAMRLQQDAQPGLLGRLGQSFVGSFGTTAGQGMGSWTNPAAFSSQNGGTSGASGMAALFA